MRGLLLTPTLGISPWLDDVFETTDLGASNHELLHILICPPDRVEQVRNQAPSRCRIVSGSGRGVYAALNAGLQSAEREDWDAFTWLNDDDRWERGAGVRSLGLLQRHSEIDGVYGRVNYIGSDGSSWGALPVSNTPADLAGLFAARIPALTQQGTWLRRVRTLELGRFDESMNLAADFDWWARAVRNGVRFAHLPLPVAAYRLHANQLSQSVDQTTSQIERSAEAVFGSLPLWRRTLRRSIFRLRNVSAVWTRWRRTGCWSSAALYRLAAGQSTAAITQKDRS